MLNPMDNKSIENFIEDEEEDFEYSILDNKDMYSWEGCYDKSWEILLDQKTSTGIQENSLETKKTYFDQHDNEGTLMYPQRKGILRNLVIIFDASDSMKLSDYKPNRLAFVLSMIEDFVNTFSTWNPLGRMCILSLCQSKVVNVSSFSDSFSEKIEIIKQLKSVSFGEGSISLYSGLHKALSILLTCALYSTREILLIFGSNKSCDKSCIQSLINELRDNGCIIYIISLSPELYILKKVTQETKGSYIVCKTPDDFRNSLLSIKDAPRWTSHLKFQLVPIGFLNPYRSTTVTLCICHNRPSLDGYICPRCSCKTCTIPSVCRVCNLYLANSLDIFQTTQQFKLPIDYYKCSLCSFEFQKGGYICTACKNVICYYCNKLKSTVLQYCPTCRLNESFRKILNTK